MKTISARPYWHQGDHIRMRDELGIVAESGNHHAIEPQGLELERIGFVNQPDGDVIHDSPVWNFDVKIITRVVDKQDFRRKVSEWRKKRTENGAKLSGAEWRQAKQNIMDDCIVHAPLRERIVTVASYGSTFMVLTSSSAVAERVISWLRQLIGTLPVVPVASHRPPWLNFHLHSILLDMADSQSFDIGSSCVLSDGVGKITVANECLVEDRITELLRSGMMVTRMEMHNINPVTDATTSTFVLDEDSNIYRLKIDLDVVPPSVASQLEAYEPWMADRYIGLFEVVNVYERLNDDLRGNSDRTKALSGLEDEEVKA